ncbi:hypothetical protein Nepgr_027617 [Nepenthes gracilis]|uniref:LOB domain-containing protein n=1 Tax=Nepenthes gracilis TaxID=150966 RepID=A0AAD3TB90_NEPGR|nr:hypothetical protein Nepgr_027617 [Nepenthes gracilis]
MASSGSPCGACKFLRRKCVKGCVFEPYFCHEQGASHFAAIHKVFGASNVSKLLAHLPISHRSEAAATISYEAQARIHDPIYGCVSHIFALQQQVVNLQAQLAALKQQAAQTLINGFSSHSSNPNNERFYGKAPFSYPQDVHSWLQSEFPSMVPPFDQNNLNYSAESVPYEGENDGSLQNLNNYFLGNYQDHHSTTKKEDASFLSFEGSSSNYSMGSLDLDISNLQTWPYQDADDLHSVAFGYSRH